MVRKLRIVAFAALSLMLVSCGGSSTTKVSRVDAGSTTDLSGRWNDTDSRLVAEEMVTDALNQRWIYKWEQDDKVPTVTIGRVVNKSHEHISVQTFIKDIERALLNSGKVDFVASGTERQQLRDEREDQSDNVAMDQRSFSGNEAGANYMMLGSINTIVDKEGKRSIIFYQIDMELIEMESNKKAWMGQKKIKKDITNSTVKF